MRIGQILLPQKPGLNRRVFSVFICGSHIDRHISCTSIYHPSFEIKPCLIYQEAYPPMQITYYLLLLMVLALFLLGLATSITGIIILAIRSFGKDVQTLATQTTKLAQKGIAEEISGLVGNASMLLDATNQLVRTTAGVGVFLTLLGMVLMAAACWLALQVYQIPL
jgi:hypothetical protein